MLKASSMRSVALAELTCVRDTEPQHIPRRPDKTINLIQVSQTGLKSVRLV